LEFLKTAEAFFQLDSHYFRTYALRAKTQAVERFFGRGAPEKALNCVNPMLDRKKSRLKLHFLNIWEYWRQGVLRIGMADARLATLKKYCIVLGLR